jgi:hypothetical protein
VGCEFLNLFSKTSFLQHKLSNLRVVEAHSLKVVLKQSTLLIKHFNSSSKEETLECSSKEGSELTSQELMSCGSRQTGGDMSISLWITFSFFFFSFFFSFFFLFLDEGMQEEETQMLVSNVLTKTFHIENAEGQCAMHEMSSFNACRIANLAFESASKELYALEDQSLILNSFEIEAKT